MGAYVEKCLKKLTGVQNKHILITGRKGAGKTTFLYYNLLKPGWDKADMLTTKGFNYETVDNKGDFDLKIWDF